MHSVNTYSDKQRNYKRNDRTVWTNTGENTRLENNVVFETSKTMCVNNNILYRFVCNNKNIKKILKNAILQKTSMEILIYNQ